jgi:3-dehydroquinate synthetase
MMQLLKKFELPLVLGAEFEREELLRIARMDKKFEKGRIRFVLLRAAGDAYVSPDVTEADLAAALNELTRQPA